MSAFDAAVPGISRRPTGAIIPATFAQERIWFLEHTERHAINAPPLALRLTGRLDLLALRRALDAMLHRHEALRTRFEVRDGRPLQVIEPPAQAPFTVDDLCDLPEPMRGFTVMEHVRVEAARPFRLSGAPLMRARLYRLGAEEHVLQVTLHHIVWDARSMTVLTEELCHLYRAFHDGRSSPWTVPAIQFADYAVWQRKRLGSDQGRRDVAYWRERLESSPPLLRLSTQRPRPRVQSFHGATHRFLLDSQLTGRLRELARRQRVTLFMVLLAGYQALLARYSGCDDIVVGVPVAGRTSRDLEDLIGLFVNTVPVRADLSTDPTVEELLRLVRHAVLGALVHQEVPFEVLLRELRVPRDPGYTAMIQVIFNLLQSSPVPSWDLPECRADVIAVEGLPTAPLYENHDQVHFDLYLSMSETDDGIRSAFNYATALFTASAIEGMADGLRELLSRAADDPGSRVSRLITRQHAARSAGPTVIQTTVSVKEGDAAQVRDLEGFQEMTLADAFEKQVLSTPDAPAVAFEDRALTYAELDAQANGLGHHLRRMGVGPEVVVGICIERSTEMVVALLGVLKAGGAYLPLDPDYPMQQLAFRLADSGASVVLTQRALRDRLLQTDVEVMCIEDVAAGALDPELGLVPVRRTSRPDNLAYVIYTSGSTGQPKGVMVSHRNVVRLLATCRRDLRLKHDDVWLVFHSYSFDFSVWEIWGGLLHGGRLVLTSSDLVRSPDRLWDLVRRERITILSQTPTAFRQLSVAATSTFAPQSPGSLRMIVFGGESLSSRDVWKWSEAFGLHTPRLVNMYGITETTVHATWHVLSVHDVEPDGPRRVGRPLSDLRIHICDDRMQQVPIGAAGELVVGGAGLARGYLGRPGLTAERFVPDPFGPGEGERLYRSGDLARYLPDGSIEYLGRLDHQVKIRGHRIELGEIEATLDRHPGVDEAVVLAWEESEGDRRLVAYIAASGQEVAVSGTQLREYLRQRLPQYMIPAVFVQLTALPRSRNGKIDRRALPKPDHVRPESGQAYVGPRNPIEEAIAGIWSELLRIGRVGVHDNFFELGGDSILGIQVVARAREQGMRLISWDIFEHQTVADLASVASR
jgi:amino acid adenylation domain-containing protein